MFLCFYVFGNAPLSYSRDQNQVTVEHWGVWLSKKKNFIFFRVVSQFGISVRYRLVFSRYFPNRYRRKTWLVRFGIEHLVGTPFSLASAPFLMDQAPLVRGVPAKFHKMELPPNLTVQKITYIPYRIYQLASAGNLPIPAKLPVNRWDTTLVFSACVIGKSLEPSGQETIKLGRS